MWSRLKAFWKVILCYTILYLNKITTQTCLFFMAIILEYNNFVYKFVIEHIFRCVLATTFSNQILFL